MIKTNSYSTPLISQHHQFKNMTLPMIFSLKLLYADLRGHCFLISPMCIYVHARISNVGVHDRDILKIPLVNGTSRQCKSVELLSICRQFGSFGEFSRLMYMMSKIYCLFSTLMFGRLSLISSRMLSSYVISPRGSCRRLVVPLRAV